MTQAALKEKVFTLESELQQIKLHLLPKKPNLSIDEDNWDLVKETSKTVRKNLYREHYGKK
jgi:hypothetical protein